MPGSDVSDHLGNEEGIVFRSFLAVHGIIPGLLLEGVKTTDASSEDHAYPVFVDTLLIVEVSVVDSFLGCLEGIHRVEIQLTHLPAVEIVLRLEVLNLTGKLRLEERRVEVRDLAGSALSLHSVFPRCRHIIAYRGERSETGDYNSF